MTEVGRRLRATPPSPQRRRFTATERRALACAMLAGCLIPLNSSMIVVGLPEMTRDLGVARSLGATVVTSYLVAMLLCQPMAGRLGDRYGTTRVGSVALVGFAVAALGAGAAPSFPVLLACRCAQALFGSALIPNAQAVLRIILSDTSRGRAFGIFASGISAGAAVGPLLGGALADISSWRAIFLVNVPIAAAAIALLNGLHAHAEPTGTSAGSGWRALRTPAFLAACGTQATANLSMYTVIIVFPIVLNDRNWTPAAIGLAVSGLMVGTVVLAPISARFGDRFGRRAPVVAGMSLVTLGCTVIALGVATPAALIVGAVIVGAGLGTSSASLQAAVVESVPVGVAGAAAGVFSTSRYVGSIIGSVAVAATSVSGAGSARTVLVLASVSGALAVVAASQVGGRGATLTP